MIPRYLLLAQRIRSELQSIERVVKQAEEALHRASDHPADRDIFIAAAAFELHSFYVGIERLFELIAAEIDENRPSGSQWHRDLLAQMVLSVPSVRPEVILPETQAALGDYLEFRHVVRNVYTFNLRTERVVELTRDMRKTFEFCRNDLLAFAAFLEKLSTADQEED